MEISKEQWDAWRADPVTVELMAWARAEREEKREIWETGSLTAENQFQTNANNMAAIGACAILRVVEALEYEEMIGRQE